MPLTKIIFIHFYHYSIWAMYVRPILVKNPIKSGWPRGNKQQKQVKGKFGVSKLKKGMIARRKWRLRRDRREVSKGWLPLSCHCMILNRIVLSRWLHPPLLSTINSPWSWRTDRISVETGDLNLWSFFLFFVLQLLVSIFISLE